MFLKVWLAVSFRSQKKSTKNITLFSSLTDSLSDSKKRPVFEPTSLAHYATSNIICNVSSHC